jgi:hypothetical protein
MNTISLLDFPMVFCILKSFFNAWPNIRPVHNQLLHIRVYLHWIFLWMYIVGVISWTVLFSVAVLLFLLICVSLISPNGTYLLFHYNWSIWHLFYFVRHINQPICQQIRFTSLPICNKWHYVPRRYLKQYLLLEDIS